MTNVWCLRKLEAKLEILDLERSLYTKIVVFFIRMELEAPIVILLTIERIGWAFKILERFFDKIKLLLQRLECNLFIFLIILKTYIELNLNIQISLKMLGEKDSILSEARDFTS